MNGLLTSTPIEGDANQNLRIAYHVYKHGVISKEGDISENLTPTNYREPVPPIITALFMYAHPGIDKNDSLASFEGGNNTKKVKQVNFVWILLLLVGLVYLIFIVSNNEYLPFLLLLFVFTYFIRFGNHFDVLITELPAATLIVWSTLLLVMALKKKILSLYLITGLCYGLLILTKAVFFYLTIFVILYLVYSTIPKERALKISFYMVGVLLTVAPWLIRNYIIYDQVEISQRAGAALHQRALLNQMTGEEVHGAIYYWGPEIYKDLVRNTSLGAEGKNYEIGGKYERISREIESDTLAITLGAPNLARSFYFQSRAEINRLQKKLGSAGEEAPRREVYEIMKTESIDMILEHPVKHTMMSLIFLWRGIWCFPNPTIPIISDNLQQYLHNIINLLSYLSLFGAFFYGLIKHKKNYVALTVIPVSMLIFQAGVTHNLSRISEPAIPLMLLCLSLLIFQIYQKTKLKLYSS